MGVAEQAGLEWDELTPRTRDELLERAQMFLSILGPPATRELAYKFNNVPAQSSKLREVLAENAELKEKIKRLETDNSNLSWSVYPDRMGQ